MLLYFRFKNHKSFYDETILDMRGTKEERHIETTFNVNGENVLPLVSIHGANAAGKTTCIDALNLMFSFVINSVNFDVNSKLSTVPFLFSKLTSFESSEYEISVCFNDVEYRYGFIINTNIIEAEWLYKRKMSNKNNTIPKIVFERYEDDIVFGPSFKNYEKLWNLFKSQTNIEKSFVMSSIARKEESGILRDIYDFICKFSIIYGKDTDTIDSAELLKGDKELRERFFKLINEFDPCLEGFEINTEKFENKTNSFFIFGLHSSIEKDEKNGYKLALNDESEGTIKMFNILPFILKNLENGGILCIDELDVKFHPILFRKIVNMYKDKSINNKCAQLIFTAHSTYMFNSNDFRRDELYLVEKNKEGKSKLYSVSDFKNVRVDADYEKKYLSGAFGAIPYGDN